MVGTVKYLILFAFVIFSFSANSCSEKENTSQVLQKVKTGIKMKEKTKQTDTDGRIIMSGLLVKKAFIMKNGKSPGFKEYYFRTSIQDYYIKFCESEIGKKELDKYSEQNSEQSIMGDIPITFELKIVNNGLWDICEEDSQHQQSRMGDYVVIYRVV